MRPHVPSNMHIIRHPQYKQIQRGIIECVDLTSEAGEPNCYCLEGRLGVGKTTLVKETIQILESQNSRLREKILYVMTPDNATLKACVYQTLSELGVAKKPVKLWVAKQMIIEQIQAQDIQVIVFDDFQHLTTSTHINTQHSNVEAITEWLKNMLKTASITAVVVGIQGQVKPAIDTNAQLSSLFTITETLDPFVWNPDRRQTIRDFSRLMAMATHELDITLDTGTSKVELYKRICYASDGQMRHLFRLLRRARNIAEEQQQHQIDLSALSMAFTGLQAGPLTHKTNPFELPLTQSFVEPDPFNYNSNNTVEDIFS